MQAQRRDRPEPYKPTPDEIKHFFFKELDGDKLYYRCSLCHPNETKCTFDKVVHDRNYKPKDSTYRANKTSVPESAVTHFVTVHTVSVGAGGKTEFTDNFLAVVLRTQGLTPIVESAKHVVFEELNCQLDSSQAYGLSLALQFQNLSVFDDALWKKATLKTRPKDVGCYRTALDLCHNVRDVCRTAALKDLASKGPVYACCDKGTIYQGMIAFIIVGAGKPIIWRIASMEEDRYKEGATADALAKEIADMYHGLVALNIQLVSFVTDNASNMRSAKALVSKDIPLVCLPCFAHLGQLVVEDVRSSREYKSDIERVLEEAKNKRTRILAETDGVVRPPCPVATRWLYDFRLLNYFEIERNKPDEVPRRFDAKYDATGRELARQTEVLNLLRPAAEFTDYIQRDSATLLEGLCALSLFTKNERMKDALLSRIRYNDGGGHQLVSFVCPATFFICLLSPNLNIGSLLKPPYDDDSTKITDLHTVVTAIISDPVFDIFLKRNKVNPATLIIELGATPPDLLRNLRRLWTVGQYQFERMSAEMYKRCYTASPDLKSHFVETWKLLSLLCNMLPTEAVCERAFSILKRIKHGPASTMKVENAAAIAEIRFLAAKGWNEPPEEEFGPLLDNGPAGNYVLATEIAQEFVMNVLNKYIATSVKNANDKCLHCDKKLNDGTNTTQCRIDTCAKTWHNACLAAGNGLEDFPTFEPGKFLCRECAMKQLQID